MLLVSSGDMETIPGPRKSSPIKFCQWNLNDLTAHDFIKVALIEVHTSTHNFIFYVCLKPFDYFSTRQETITPY